MAEQANNEPGVDACPGRIRFHYIKSNAFRVVHADGVIGSLSPNGRFLQVGVFSERHPIPQQTVHQLDARGRIGSEDLSARISKMDVVREVEAEILFDQDTAKRLHRWLGRQLKAWDQLVSALPAGNAEEEDDDGSE